MLFFKTTKWCISWWINKTVVISRCRTVWQRGEKGKKSWIVYFWTDHLNCRWGDRIYVPGAIKYTKSVLLYIKNVIKFTSFTFPLKQVVAVCWSLCTPFSLLLMTAILYSFCSGSGHSYVSYIVYSRVTWPSYRYRSMRHHRDTRTSQCR